MEKEAYSNYAVLRRQDRNRAKDRDLDGPFSPSAPGKLPLSIVFFAIVFVDVGLS